MPRAKSPRWRRRKDKRPAEIVAAALEAFAERGFAATRLDDVAVRAGVSKGTLYLYFRNKEDLFKAVVRETLLPNLAAVEERLQTATGPTREVLAEVLRGLVTMVATTRLGAIPKLIISESGNFPDLARFYFEEVLARGMALFGRIVQRGIARGEFRAVDVAYAPPVLAAPILLMAMWKNAIEPHVPAHAKGMLDPHCFVATHVDMLLNGLLARPAAGE